MQNLYRVFLHFLCVYIFFLLSVSGCSREPQKAEVPPLSAKSEVVPTTAVLATIGDDEKPVGSQDLYGHGETSSDQGATSIFTIVFNEVGGGVAYTALKEGKSYVVHNGKAGKLFHGVGTPVLNSDGKRIAYGARENDHWRMVTDGREGKVFDKVGDPVFSPDGKHIAYAAKKGEKWHLVVDSTMSAGSASISGKPVFSSDSTKIAYLENAEAGRNTRLVVSDLDFKKQTIMENCAFMVISEDKRKVAATLAGDANPRVIEFSLDRPDAVMEGPRYDLIGYLVFGSGSLSLSYTAQRDGKNYIVLNGKEEALPDASPVAPPVIRPDRKGVGIILGAREIFLYEAFYSEGRKEKQYEEADYLTYNRNGSIHAYAARKGKDWFVVVNGKEGPAFDRVVKPIFSPGGEKLVYRARKDGKRFIVVADESGKTISQHPAYEQVFQPVFTADGKSVAYGVKDGQKLIWKVEKL
jgi:hypothetical protein